MTFSVRLLLSYSLLAVGSVAYASNISGTYVGLYSNAADLLQVVERPDGSILGHYEQVMLSSAGTGISRMNATVTGAVSGDTLVLTLKPAEFMGTAIPLSGTIRGDIVQLSGGSGGNSFDVVMRPSSESVFTQQVQRLTAQANQAATVDAAQRTLAHTEKVIEHLTEWMRDYSKNAIVHLQRLPKAPAAWAKFTERMQAALTREMSLPTQSYARSQVDYAIGSMDYQFNSWHYGLQSVESSFGYSGGKIAIPKEQQIASEQALAYCGVAGHSATPICEKFSTTYANFRTTVQQLEQAFTIAETAWKAEHAKQKAIEKQADALSKDG
ncbi:MULTISPECIES: hypothetical protein [unclassified Thiomonas]|uniref:hypothetical protein n=1 Tax=unclassified Thiomonas TaxID=2625466 RepID=UPI0004DBC84E|nr:MULTISPECIES: hypothetical protein [unclassified Thiomonas]CDW96320.1 conserved exported hypothetical protein [Thiomonas sp. CB2]VDY06750.1 conserved exported protein of unknown function [Thiomonas sp. Bio17B3]VDY09956.1 conserved exported protein of unknown function [Thiomonas sp. Sup16B3]VDY11198.1 conserved exported protein of unknown function [Thiomonas sp. Sup16B3]VDY11261.1 conserved exported protein of unknown function [Thiomonas sp. Bio17B3]